MLFSKFHINSMSRQPFTEQFIEMESFYLKTFLFSQYCSFSERSVIVQTRQSFDFHQLFAPLNPSNDNILRILIFLHSVNNFSWNILYVDCNFAERIHVNLF